MEKQLEQLGSRWAAVCQWTEDQWVLLQEVLLRWQQFSDEQTKFSVWLAEKEGILTNMGQADLSDPDQVIVQVKHLKVSAETSEGVDLWSWPSHAGQTFEGVLNKRRDADFWSQPSHFADQTLLFRSMLFEFKLFHSWDEITSNIRMNNILWL